ncbi:MAG: DNA primase [Caulobacteraceae bacterium]
MRFDDRFLEEIKSRLRLSDVIGRTVKLRRQGREFVGLSPFSKEKSPSFYVNDEKGFFHDFSSGKHGDLIGFLQETMRLSFPEAVEMLAGEAGVPMPVQDPRAAEVEQKRRSLEDWLDLAAQWYEAQLRRPIGEAARAYLERRGLGEAEQTKFHIGYAPGGRNALKDYLVSKGAMPAALVETGLLIGPEDGGAPYDRFRDRIMFPITDGRGRTISFGGRALDPEAKAKYLNGPETPLFHKGSTLFGLFEAKKALHTVGEDAPLVVVEGYMDVIACQRAGVAAVAPLGTALTEEQMAALWRLHEEPTLCFDADGAGQRAAARVIDRALPLLKPGRTFKFALISGGKDPDDVLREQGVAALKAQLAVTRPFVDVLFEREKAAAEPLDTPERRTALKVALRKLAGLIADQELSHSYREDLLARTQTQAPERERRPWTPPEAGRGGGRKWDKNKKPLPGGATLEGKAAAQKLATALRPVAAAVAKAILVNPQLIDEQLETLEVQGLGDAGLDGIAKEIIRFRLMAPSLDSGSLQRHLATNGFDAFLKEISRAAEQSGAPFLQAGLSLEQVRAPWLHALDRLIQIAALERAVSDAKAELERDASAFGDLKLLKAERDALQMEVGSGTLWSDEASYIAATLQ